MNPGTYVAVDGASLGKVSSVLISCYQRAIITGAAGPLGSFITAIGQAQSGIPYYYIEDNPSKAKVFPKAVDLQIEAGQTGLVYSNDDGHDINLGGAGAAEVTATHGLNIVPLAPAWVRFPVDCNPTAGVNNTGLIRVLASTGTVNVQCRFEF